MIIEPKGWEADCDGVDGDSCFNEIKSDDYDYEDTKNINSEEKFEEFIKRLGWAVKDGEHFCPECAEKLGLEHTIIDN